MTAAEFRAWRLEHGLSQAAAAKVLGLSWSTVQRYDTGNAPIPGPVAAVCRGVERHPELVQMLREG